MTYEHILTETEDGVGIITLNRPDKLNAMNRKLSTELHDAVKRMEADDAIGCIVITGAGDRAFSAGGDIHEQREDDRKYTQEQLDAMSGGGRRSYDIAACAKPTIGMINGLAYGGAAVLSSSLDMRVGCEATRFRFLAAAYGRINSTWTLPNQVGWPIAKELLFSARVVEALRRRERRSQFYILDAKFIQRARDPNLVVGCKIRADKLLALAQRRLDDIERFE